jgi:hypothetical protein
VGLLALVCAVSLQTAGAQEVPAPLPLFASDEPLMLKIEGPLRELARANRDRPWFPSRLSYTTEDGRETALDVELRIRGNSRLELCRFPPLRLDFVRKQLVGTVFEGQNRLKLVTLCQRQQKYRDYLGLEFAAYRIFNALTEQSFRVRWASIEYVMTDDPRRPPYTEPAFLIEEDWEVAERSGMTVIERERLGVDELDPRQAALLGLFQYVIGNTDWAGLEGPGDDPCCHNGKVIQPTTGAFFVLPYDFDQAGLVDAEYARPDQRLKLNSVRERRYRGYCAVNSAIGWAVDRFNERRAAVEAAITTAPLSDRAKEKALSYLNSAYEILNDPARLQKEIFDDCRG